MEQKRYQIFHVGKEQAVLLEQPAFDKPLEYNEVEGWTLVTAVSPGTEVRGSYCGTHYQLTDLVTPRSSGYAAVFEIEHVGKDVHHLQTGDLVYSDLPHRAYQRVNVNAVVKLPQGIRPEHAVLCRFPKISMPAFVETHIRPPEKAVVTGLGLVGLMAAQIAQMYGYTVIATDIDKARCDIAEKHGIHCAVQGLTEDAPEVSGKIGLGVDCTGHEQAELDLCNMTRIGGEVFLVGVPWVARTDLSAHKILHAVFYNQISLRSGWEAHMHGAEGPHNGIRHYEATLRWIHDKKIQIHESMYNIASPQVAQEAYQAILKKTIKTLTTVFDWQLLR